MLQINKTIFIQSYFSCSVYLVTLISVTAIFIPWIDYSHSDRIHSSLTVVHCFDNGYVGKQPVALKECCAEHWYKGTLGKDWWNNFNNLKPFPKQPLVFTHLQYKSFWKLCEKGEISHNEQFLLFPQCFLSIRRTFCNFHQIGNCCLQTLSVWKSLKFVVWDRVKHRTTNQSLSCNLKIIFSLHVTAINTSEWHTFRLVEIESIYRRQNESHWKIKFFFWKGVGKGGNAPFPTLFSKGFSLKVVKNWDCVVNRLTGKLNYIAYLEKLICLHYLTQKMGFWALLNLRVPRNPDLQRPRERQPNTLWHLTRSHSISKIFVKQTWTVFGWSGRKSTSYYLLTTYWTG